MKLTGIIDYSMGNFLCIRGFTNAKTLRAISKADDVSYQRFLDKKHLEDIKFYLNQAANAFFPEVILSYTLKYDFTKPDAVSGLIPRDEIFKKGFYSNVLPFTIKGKQGKIATLEIKYDYFAKGLFDTYGDDIYFKRIDGNHRIAAMNFEDEKATNFKIPFCIILLDDKADETKKTQYYLFNSINSKSQPLTDYEQIKGMLNLFSPSELRDANNFEKRYYLCSILLEQYRKNHSPIINKILPNENKAIEFFYNILKTLEDKELLKSETNYSIIFDRIIQHWQIIELQENKSEIIAADILNLIAYGEESADLIKWAIKTEVNKHIKSNQIFEMFRAFRTSFSKDIFYSLGINLQGANDRYNAVDRAVKKINAEYHLGLKLTRLDKMRKGESYQFTEEIEKCIKSSGLLIADISGGNLNVIHEIGFMMGYNSSQNQSSNKNILITLCNEMETEVSKMIPSNIRQHRAIPYKDVTQLETEIFEEMKAKYINL